MIINHSHRFIFIHVPKTAGTSITGMLSKLTRYNDLELGGTKLGEAIAPFYRERFGLAKHSTVAEVREVVGANVWDSYFSFTFVRNPYLRSLSTFFYLRNQIARGAEWIGGSRKKSALIQAIAGAADFNEFVLAGWLDREGEALGSLFRPQLRWLEGRDQPGQIAISYVGKLENLESDFSGCLQKIGVDELLRDDAKIPQKNASLASKVHITPDAARLIRERYAEDFRAFEYSLDSPFE